MTLLARFILPALVAAQIAASSHGASWNLAPTATVTTEGIFLDDILRSDTGDAVPHVLVASPPPVGRVVTLSRAEVLEAVSAVLPGTARPEIKGGERVSVARRMRNFSEEDLVQLLSAQLSETHCRGKGQLEIRLTRPWLTTSLPDGPLSLRIVEFPASGLSARTLLRFELRAGDAKLGSWQALILARWMAEVCVAATALKPGQLLTDADVTTELRDVLSLRDPVRVLPEAAGNYEAAEVLPAGTPLTSHSLRPRTVIQRGKVVDAVLSDGAFMITVRALVLENGRPGDWVRARNLKSAREFKGRVVSEHTISVTL